MGVDHRGQVLGDVGGDLGEVARFLAEPLLGPGGVRVGEGVEIVDEAAEPEEVVVHVDKSFEGGFGDAVDDLFAVALQDGERGS